MRIALAQLNYHIGNFASNEQKILDAINKAKTEGADLVVFSELAISGYPPRDFLVFDDFIAACIDSIKKIAESCQGISAIVGAPALNPSQKGKKIQNAAYFLSNGSIASIHSKALLPTYDVFDEDRYFEAAESFECIKIGNTTIALTICEDIWSETETISYNRSIPMEELIKENPDLIINIAASPFSQKQIENRKKVLQANAKKYKLPIYYVNHVGAQTELIFDGGSCAANKAGEITHQLQFFQEDFLIIDSDAVDKHSQINLPNRYERIEGALVLGIKDYFRKLGFKRATLGLSGGIDSALTMAIAVKALGKENVIPILMPSQFSSEHSITDSLKLCENLGCDHHLIEIENIYEAFNNQLQPLFEGLSFGIAEENIQARIRGSLLMAHTNKFGTILLNTSNKSEMAVGYSTLYGDMCGGISVLGDLYKTEVYELAEHLNKKQEIIPLHILKKEPSAELRPDQKDSDALPEYEVLDSILIEYLENQLSPNKIIAKGFDPNLVNKILRMVNINEYKRHQAPPILRVSEKAFGMGRRMPIVGKYLI